MIPIQDIDFSALSLIERVQLAQALLDGVVAAGAAPLTSEQEAELHRRIALADAGQMSSSSWPEVKARLLNRR